MPTLAFHGAAGTVTGSRHLLTVGSKQILIDCGLFQGPEHLRALNWDEFPFDPHELDAVIVTHAHTDHIGMLPKLAALGLKAPIYATPATIDLSKISLLDGAHIQEEDARFHNKHRTSRHTPALPLYTEENAQDALKKFRPLGHFTQQDLPGGASFRFMPAGHILGSAMAEITLPDGQRLLMSGDIGRWDRPLLKDPYEPDGADFLVMESTYGDRLHGDEDPYMVLERIIGQAYDDGGIVLVPSFAIGRTQEMLFLIDELTKQGRIPRIPIYVDSPMATATTLLYTKHSDELDLDVRVDMREGQSPMSPDMVQFVRDAGMSRSLNSARGPMMIISGSGMATGGRIVHHMKHHLSDPTTTLLFTGYQAEGTMGRNMIEGATEVKIHGSMVPVAARVEQMSSLSAHADQSELLKWLSGFQAPPKITCLVHGEPEVQEILRSKIQEEKGWDVQIPTLHSSISLD